MKEQILLAVKKGEPDWKETLITDKPEHFENAKKHFQDEYDRFRVATIDLNKKPNFINTIQ